MVSSLNPVEIFRTTTLALQEVFVAAKKSLSRSSSWQSEESDDEDEEDEVPVMNADNPSPMVTKKQRSTLSHGTSNVSDVSSSEEAKKRRIFGRFRSKKEGRPSRKQHDTDTLDQVDAATGKKTRFRTGSRVKVRRNCVIQ